MITQTNMGKPSVPTKKDVSTITDPTEKKLTNDVVKNNENNDKAREKLDKYKERTEKYKSVQQKQIPHTPNVPITHAAAYRVAQSFIKIALPTSAIPPDPNKDPDTLYLNIKSTLNELGLKSTMVESEAYVNLLEKKIIGGNNMNKYKVGLRTNVVIDRDTVTKMNDDKFDKIILNSNKKMEAHVWAPEPVIEQTAEQINQSNQ